MSRKGPTFRKVLMAFWTFCFAFILWMEFNKFLVHLLFYFLDDELLIFLNLVLLDP